MTIFDQVSGGIISAMKSREKVKLDALRNLKKAMIEARTTKGAGAELTDDEALKIIQKLVKQGRESAELYRTQNRQDLYDEETAQVKVMETFLPEQISGEKLTAAIIAIIQQTGATSLKDMGKVIGTASKELAGKAEGRDIAAKVKELLS
jgi:uncharacterized protein YqeY